MIVKFVSRTTKSEIIQNRRALKGTKIVIKEDLTQTNQRLLKSAQEHRNVKSAWSSNGKIFVKSHNDAIKPVLSIQDLDAMAGPPSEEKRG